MNTGTYLAAEDSVLLRRALSRYEGETCLEMGAGNAGNLVALATRFEFPVGTDLSAPTMADWRKRRISYVVCDTGTCFRDASFDLVAFNPPYLPSDEIVDRAVDAGNDGRVPMAFLKEALRVVKRGGRIVMLLNDQAKVQDFEDECRRANYKMTLMERQRVFFEELFVYEASAV